MRKSALTIATVALAAAAMQSSAAQARGLRIGIGLGIGIGLPLAIHGARAHHSHPRTETIINGRYRCCSEHRHVERHVIIRPAKAPPRVRHVEKPEKAENEVRRVIRKKPTKTPPAEIIMVRESPSKQTSSKPTQMADNGHQATIQKAETTVPAMATTPAAVALTATASGQPSPASSSMTAAATVPRQAARIDTVGQGAPEAAPVEGGGDLNCRRYFPSLGKTLAVSCME